MTEEELDEVLANYKSRYGDRIRTHCDVCWTWADHAECTVPRLVAEVRRLRKCLLKANDSMEEAERSLYLQLQDAEAERDRLNLESAKRKAEIAEWTNAARKVFNGPPDADDYEDFDQRRDQVEREGLTALNELMNGNGWCHLESESVITQMRRELERVKDDRDYWKAMTDGEEEIEKLRSLIAHCRVHSGYQDCGSSRMDTAMRTLYESVIAREAEENL